MDLSSNRNHERQELISTANKSKLFLIYVVDYQSINLEAISDFLQKYGFQVITESSILKAINQIESMRPDLILLNILMPDLGGLDACKLLKSSSHTKDIPIIITEVETTEQKTKAIDLGAFDYLTKPLQFPELLVRVNRCFKFINLIKNLTKQNQVLRVQIKTQQREKFKIKKSENTLKTIINNDLNGMIVLDPNGSVLFLNRRAEKLFNRSPQEMIGENLGLPLQMNKVSELDIFHQPNHLITVEIRCVPIIWDNNNAYLITVTDITDRKKMEEKLTILYQASEQSPASIIITNTEGKIEYVNSKFEFLSGYKKQELLGEKIHIFNLSNLSQDDAKNLLETISAGEEWQGEISYQKKNSDFYWVKLLISPIFSKAKMITHYIAIIEDITNKKEEELNLKYQAKYDNLTKIPNRNYGLEKVNSLLLQAQENSTKLGLMFIDLDHFKEVNDSLGHDYGDELLIQASKRMQNAIRSTDLLVRLGGDEFFIAVPFSENNHLDTIAQKIINILAQEFVIFSQSVFISASIGITIFPDDSFELKKLIRNADLAMYKSKQNGKNQFQFYHSKMNTLAFNNANLKDNFQQAIAQGEFKVVYQPVVEIKSKKVVSSEALLRWENPESGLIYPEKFIPLLEKNGLMIKLEDWLLQAIFQDIKTWPQLHNTPISINISEEQFQDEYLFERLQKFINSYHSLQPHLQIEIKEEMLLERKYLINKIIQNLSALNISLCLDNFAGSFSSLAQLSNLNLKFLKIDQSLIHQLEEDEQVKVLVKSIIILGRALGIKTVAKGIETKEQLEMIQQLQCDYAQGYFFSQPLSPSNLIKYLQFES